MSASNRLRELLERLVSPKVPFVPAGGLAVNAWGRLRATSDVGVAPCKFTSGVRE